MVPVRDRGEHGASQWILSAWRGCVSNFVVQEATKQIMDNTIVMDTNADGRPLEATYTPTIICCDPQREKPHNGWYNRYKKKYKKVHINIKQ